MHLTPHPPQPAISDHDRALAVAVLVMPAGATPGEIDRIATVLRTVDQCGLDVALRIEHRLSDNVGRVRRAVERIECAIG